MKSNLHKSAKRCLGVAADLELDPSARIGCLPERKISDQYLTIGAESVIRSGAVIYAGSSIGARLNMGHNAIIRGGKLYR